MKCYVFRLKKRMLVIPLAVLAAIGICVAAFAGRGGESESDLFPSEYGLDAETLANAVPQSESGQKVAYLTFDDGPSPQTTATLLDGLKERGAHATFFLIGEQIAGNEDLVRR